MAELAISCSQCGAPLPDPEAAAGGAAVQVCEYCETVVVSKQGQRRVAGRAAATDGGVDWSEALCCRLCGGALPQAVVATPEQASCAYCGHRALLRPGVIAALRLVMTRPSLAPPTLRRALFYNLAFVVLAIAMTAVGIWRHDGTTRFESAQIALAEVAVGDVLADWTVSVPAYTERFGIRVGARELDGGSLGVAVTYRHDPSATCQAERVNISKRKSVDANRKLALAGKPPAGEVRVQLVVTSVSDTPSGQMQIILSGSQAFPLGYLILLLNAVFWLTVLNVRAGVDFTALRRRGATVTKVVSALFLAAWLLVAVLGWDPLAAGSMQGRHRSECGQISP